jgi:accessory gene regulator protein AgrB
MFAAGELSLKPKSIETKVLALISALFATLKGTLVNRLDANVKELLFADIIVCLLVGVYVPAADVLTGFARY